MKDFLLALLHLAVMTAKLCGPGDVRAVIAENLSSANIRDVCPNRFHAARGSRRYS